MPRRRRPPAPPKPTLSVRQILAWADAYHRRWGRWPKRNSGYIAGTAGETWSAVDAALYRGHRGLPNGGSLIKLLAEHCGYRHRNYLPRLSVRLILRWADAHFESTGDWPSRGSGPVADAPGETWNGIDIALERGTRGLPGGSSLFRLLKQHRKFGGKVTPFGKRRRQPL
jgi:hypothetical protein